MRNTTGLQLPHRLLSPRLHDPAGSPRQARALQLPDRLLLERHPCLSDGILLEQSYQRPSCTRDGKEAGTHRNGPVQRDEYFCAAEGQESDYKEKGMRRMISSITFLRSERALGES